MTRRSFGQEIYEATRRVQGWLFGLLGLAISLLALFVSNTTTVQGRWVVVGGTLLFAALTVTLDVAITLHTRSGVILPRVMRSAVPGGIYARAECLLLLEASPTFGHESLVSIYSRIDEFEILIGVGFVLTVQADGLVQVLVTESTGSEYQDRWTGIQANNERELRALIVKPSIPRGLSPAVNIPPAITAGSDDNTES